MDFSLDVIARIQTHGCAFMPVALLDGGLQDVSVLDTTKFVKATQCPLAREKTKEPLMEV